MEGPIRRLEYDAERVTLEEKDVIREFKKMGERKRRGKKRIERWNVKKEIK